MARNARAQPNATLEAEPLASGTQTEIRRRTRAVRQARLLIVGLVIGCALAFGCRRESSKGTPVQVVVDDYADLPAGAHLRLVVSDSNGNLVAIRPDDGSGTFSADVPLNGAVTLLFQAGAPAAYYASEWVAPPVPTIHALLFFRLTPSPTPIPTADATTWDVTLTAVPPDTLTISVIGRCAYGGYSSSAFTSTAEVIASDQWCGSPSPTTFIALASGGANQLEAWGEATSLTPSPGGTAPVSIALTSPIRTTTVTISNVSDGFAATNAFLFGAPTVTDMTSGVGTLTMRSFGGFAEPTSIDALGTSPGGAVLREHRSPIPETFALDGASFPASGPVVGTETAEHSVVSWGPAEAFGSVGYARVEWGSSATPVTVLAWVPPDRRSLTIPAFPSDVPPPSGIAGFTDAHAQVILVDSTAESYATAVSQPWWYLLPTGPETAASNYRSIDLISP